MPDDRMLHKRLGTGEKVCKLTDFEFRVWVQYQLAADDCGVMVCAVAPLQAENYYLAEQSGPKIAKALDRLLQLALVRAFDHQGRMYLCQLDWQDWQGVRYPRESVMPEPPPEVLAMMTPATVALFNKRRKNIAEKKKKRLAKLAKDYETKPPHARAGAGAPAKRLTANGERQEANGEGQEAAREDDETPAPPTEPPDDPSPMDPLPRPLIDGRSQRFHGTHSYCGPRACVPYALEDDLVKRIGGDAKAARSRLVAWYPEVEARWEGRTVPADIYAFWRAEFDVDFSDPVAAKPQNTRANRSAQTIARVAAQMRDREGA